MGAPVVVFIDERIELVLEVFEDSGFGFGGEPLFECLLEPFYFPACGGVVWSGVFLDDSQVHQGAFEPVLFSFPSCESYGVDEGVVGEY